MLNFLAHKILVKRYVRVSLFINDAYEVEFWATTPDSAKNQLCDCGQATRNPGSGFSLLIGVGEEAVYKCSRGPVLCRELQGTNF